MTVIRFEDRGSARLCLARKASRDSKSRVPPVESGVWPDSATVLTHSEIERLRENNKYKDVFWDVIWGVGVSVGMVVFLIALLDVLGVK